MNNKINIRDKHAKDNTEIYHLESLQCKQSTCCQLFDCVVSSCLFHLHYLLWFAYDAFSTSGCIASSVRMVCE